MNKKAVAAFLSLAFFCSQPVAVLADPTVEEQVEASRNSLMELEDYLGKLEDEIRGLDEDILNAQETITSNQRDIDALQIEIEEGKEKLEVLLEEIILREEILGGRLRSMYKSNRLNDYLAILLNCNDFSDFIAKAKALGKIIESDQGLIEELELKREEVEEVQKGLKERSERLKLLQEENEAKLKELEDKKEEQQELLEEAHEKRRSIKVDLKEQEEELISFPVSVINSSASSDAEIQSSIDNLRALRGNILTVEVEDKLVEAIENGKVILADREAKRKAEEEEARRKAEEEEKRRQEEAERQEQEAQNNSSNNTSGSNNNSNSTNNNSSSSNSGSGNTNNNSSQGSVNNSGSTNNTGTSNGRATGVDIVNYAYKFLGTPYLWGGTTPAGFDCSGFTQYVYRQFGYYLGRTTYDQIYNGRAVSQSELQPGDLVFTSAGHIGIYVSNGRMIHAPQTGDVIKISNIWSFYAARRIIN